MADDCEYANEEMKSAEDFFQYTVDAEMKEAREEYEETSEDEDIDHPESDDKCIYVRQWKFHVTGFLLR